VHVQVAEHGAFGRTVLGARLALFGAFKGFIRCQVAINQHGGGQHQAPAGSLKPVIACFSHVIFTMLKAVAAYCVTAGVLIPLYTLFAPVLHWNRSVGYVRMTLQMRR